MFRVKHLNSRLPFVGEVPRRGGGVNVEHSDMFGYENVNPPVNCADSPPTKGGAKSPKRCQRQMKRGDFADIVLQTDR